MHSFLIKRFKEHSMTTNKFIDRIIWQTSAKNHLIRASLRKEIQILVQILKLLSQANISTALLNAKGESNSYMISSRQTISLRDLAVEELVLQYVTSMATL